MDTNYQPVVPKWVADILELDKKRRQNQYSGSIASGQTRKDWEAWQRKYSRKLKYARLNGWIVEETIHPEFNQYGVTTGRMRCQ